MRFTQFGWKRLGSQLNYGKNTYKSGKVFFLYRLYFLMKKNSTFLSKNTTFCQSLYKLTKWFLIKRHLKTQLYLKLEQKRKNINKWFEILKLKTIKQLYISDCWYVDSNILNLKILPWFYFITLNILKFNFEKFICFKQINLNLWHMKPRGGPVG